MKMIIMKAMIMAMTIMVVEIKFIHDAGNCDNDVGYNDPNYANNDSNDDNGKNYCKLSVNYYTAIHC